MNETEFKKLCENTAAGTTLSFSYRDMEISGTFVGCADDAVIIEANGRQYLWPRELCAFTKSSYPRPSYS